MRSLVRLLLVLPLAALLVVVPVGCQPRSSEVVLEPYLPRTAHQAYGHALAQASLTQAALGLDWLKAAERALSEPQSVSTPFEVSGQFDPARADAFGYAFSVRSGQRLDITIEITSSAELEAFVDLYRLEAGGRPQHVASAAPGAAGADGPLRRRISLDVLEDGEYVLRVQPELLRGGAYELAIRSGPALAFPVSGLGMRAVQSLFGAERDGGRRSHRGVDIFAERGTPVIAARDAWVSRVETTPRGGNVVWLQDLFSPLRLYYAHLDSQLVRPGQFVTAGEVVGTVGNTGNAITTPPHLHFGVYVRRRGARDPVAFLR